MYSLLEHLSERFPSVILQQDFATRNYILATFLRDSILCILMYSVPYTNQFFAKCAAFLSDEF